jgi:hypothetical protein
MLVRIDDKLPHARGDRWQRLACRIKRRQMLAWLAAFTILLALALAGCGKWQSADAAAIDAKKKLLGQLRANLGMPLSQRIQAIPLNLLESTRAHDRSIGIDNASAYAARTPSEAERALVMQYIDLLPPAVQRIFRAKLLAIYLVDGFAGAGLTDWVIDGDGESYYYLIFNSALLEQPLDAWLSYKDNSVFDDASMHPAIRVRSQTPYKALLYGLLHEGAHVADYELGLTPYVEPLHRKLSKRLPHANAFSGAVWAEHGRPLGQFDFPHRADMNVYRIFTRKALVPRSELPAMYERLRASPFVSFYSASTWNEHLADFLTYHHIEHKLGGNIRVELVDEGKLLGSYEPMRQPMAQRLAPVLKVFYQ